MLSDASAELSKKRATVRSVTGADFAHLRRALPRPVAFRSDEHSKSLRIRRVPHDTCRRGERSVLNQSVCVDSSSKSIGLLVIAVLAMRGAQARRQQQG